MFKAIGKWGAQVKAGLNFQFISNIFGSKSKNYNNIDNDEEEIFIDANEELVDDQSDTEGGSILMRVDCVDQSKPTDDIDSPTPNATDNISAANNKPIAETNDVAGETLNADELTIPHAECEPTEIVVSHTSDCEADVQTCDSDDEHCHDDKTKIVKTPATPSNGVIQGAASSAIKKVHRRINSYSQRQYSKIDSNADDENDNIIQTDKNTDECDGKIDNEMRVFLSIKDVNQVPKEKKSKRRKKVPIFSFLRGLLRLTPRKDSEAMMN